LRLPCGSRHVRVDTGYAEGDAVGVHYDPLIAKVIAWDRDRAAAVVRLGRALKAVEIAGVGHNTAFLAAVIGHPAFAAARLDTGFLERHRKTLLARSRAPEHVILALACVDVLLCRRAAVSDAARASSDPHSPWNRVDGWRLNGDGADVINVHYEGREIAIGVTVRTTGWTLDLPGGAVLVDGEPEPADTLTVRIDGVLTKAAVVRAGAELHVIVEGATHTLAIVDPLAASAEGNGPAAGIVSLLPGRIVKVMVKAGQSVNKGAALMIVEAMKMEHTFRAPADGRVERVNFRLDDVVAEGAALVAFTALYEGCRWGCRTSSNSLRSVRATAYRTNRRWCRHRPRPRSSTVCRSQGSR